MPPRVRERRRPRTLKTPQGFPTLALHVRIAEPAYLYLEAEARRSGVSMARALSDILLRLKLAATTPTVR